MCRSTPAIGTTDYEDLGYATPIALATALGEWLGIHTWSLSTIVDATVYLCPIFGFTGLLYGSDGRARNCTRR